MKNLTSLKLSTASIGSTALRVTEPAEEVEAPTTQTLRVEQPAPAHKSSVKKHLLVLAGVELTATCAAVAAAGSIHSTVFRIAAAGLALTVALVVAIETLAPRRRKPQAAAAAPVAARAPIHKGLNKTRVALLFLMAIGFATYFGGVGTFASFTAQTNNPNESIASGSLLMQNTIGSLCESKSGAANDNVNAACNTAFSFSNQQPGVYSGTANLTLTNSGTLNAAKLYLFAPYANGVLSSDTLTGGNVSALNLSTASPGPNGMEGPVSTGDTIVVTYGGTVQSFTASANAAAGATTISVNATAVPTAAVTAGATVEDTSSDTAAANTNCYDTQVTNLGFNPTTNNPLCSAAVLFVQENTGGKYYCWWGSGTGSANGQCDAPISVNPTGLGSSGNQTIAANTYTVGALNGNIKSGDQIQFQEGANKVQCPASSDVYFTATSITVGACTLVSGVNGTFDNGATVTDVTSLGRIASDTTHNISKFDTTAKSTAKIELQPVSANGTLAPAANDLASGASRTFILGVTIPGPATPQNGLQQLKSTFGMSWQLSQ